jgi:hypothetical protein
MRKKYCDHGTTCQAHRRFSRDQHATVSGDMKMVRPLIEVFDEVKKFSFPRTGVDKMATITFRSETLYYYQIKSKGHKVSTNMVVAPAGLEPATF